MQTSIFNRKMTSTILLKLLISLACIYLKADADTFTPNATNQTLVHLFEWKWNDIAAECENFLADKGYSGVQVSPPTENAVVSERPWWERYQPVSYILESRSGTEAEFASMVSRCNAVGVRIYADAIINHMTLYSSGVGTGGSTFNGSSLSYPAVNYTSTHFNNNNCPTGPEAHISPAAYTNSAIEVRNCRLGGLQDLNQGNTHVREKIAEYLNRLLSYGVEGFRIDAAKHMWPGDLEIIFDALNNTIRGDRPYINLEVIDPYDNEAISSSDYIGLGRVTEFKYSLGIGDCFRTGNTQLQYLRNFGEEWSFLDRHKALVFVDNHDNQRGHGGGGNVVTYKESRLYKMATGFMLGYDYGYTRVMSSFGFDDDFQGPPNLNEVIASPIFNSAGACTQESGWICEHRWRQIYNMVHFRNVCHGTAVNDWWDNGGNKIAFCRGNRGFVAINKDWDDMGEWLQTCLPSGNYCNVIDYNVVGEGASKYCTGPTITVYNDGKAYIEIKNSDYDGIFAIHIESKIG